jgi:hypothetical protein
VGVCSELESCHSELEFWSFLSERPVSPAADVHEKLAKVRVADFADLARTRFNWRFRPKADDHLRLAAPLNCVSNHISGNGIITAAFG